MASKDLESDTANEKTALQVKTAPKLTYSYHTLNEEERKLLLKEGLNSYAIHELITLRVFFIIKGTVLTSALLWKETGLTLLLYLTVFTVLYHVRQDGFSRIVGSEASIRAFISMFSMLIGLLLSFYTSLNLRRWNQMRDGAQQIIEGCKKLTMMVSQGVKPDENFDKLLETISRYARASLYIVFAASTPGEDPDLLPHIRAVKVGLLTEEEAKQLEQCSPSQMPYAQAETLWVWLANAVTRLHDEGRTKGPPHYTALMGAVEMGRSGVSCIQSYLDSPIPLGYVHMLCYMVKFHNAILNILMAITSVMLAGGAKGFQAVGVFRTAFRAFFMPFLYNAILILNAEVNDPFGVDAADFDFNLFDVNIVMSTMSYSKASKNLPKCLAFGNMKKKAAGP